jgi:hypothetical protein
VPQRSLNAVGELLKNLLQQWRHHSDAGDHLQAECALKALCALPRLLLANKPRARNRAKTQQAEPEAGQTTPLHTKIAMAHEARWRELWKFHEHPDTAGTSRPMSLKQQALETEACIAAGALGKALQCVKGKTPWPDRPRPLRPSPASSPRRPSHLGDQQMPRWQTITLPSMRLSVAPCCAPPKGAEQARTACGMNTYAASLFTILLIRIFPTFWTTT